MKPAVSDHFQSRKPSAIRQAQITFAERADADAVTPVNLAIGNVSLPMHPAMRERLRCAGTPEGGFADGVVKYTATVGVEETRRAFLNVIGAAGASTEGLQCVVTDGGSMAMELMILGTCGPVSKRPLMLLDPAYTNYMDIAKRSAVPTTSFSRVLTAEGVFTTPSTDELDALLSAEQPAALVVIPADNPTGQFLDQDALDELGRLCVKHNLWLVSDEAYRQLQYGVDQVSSVWCITEERVPGITGRRISIESASKVWNACGLRIGALVTDSPEFHARAVAEYTANLSSNALGQHVFAALGGQSHEELREWFARQRGYYEAMMTQVAEGLREALPGIVVTRPQAALYAVVDVRELVGSEFDALAFVNYCAREGRVNLEGQEYTLLVAPLSGFYGRPNAQARTQMRMAFVEPPERMALVPQLFAQLLAAFREA
jgi:aspartate aminotransferase